MKNTSSNLNDLFSKVRNNHIIPMVFIAVLLSVAGLFLNNKFLSPANIGNIFNLTVILGLAAAGQTLVIISGGGIDISAGSVMSLGAIIAVEVMNLDNSRIFLSIIIIIGVCGLIGLFNALGIIFAEIPPLVMTLAMSNIVMSIQLIYSKGTPNGKPAPLITFLGTARIFPWLPWLLILGVVMIILMNFLMKRAVLGQQFYASGNNEDAALMAGLRIKKIRGIVYILSSVLAGIAGFWFAANNTFISVGIANHYILPVIAAVIIGGSPLSGGKGNYTGTMAGALVLTLVVSLLIMMRTSEPLKQIINGAILLSLMTLYNREKSIRQ